MYKIILLCSFLIFSLFGCNKSENSVKPDKRENPGYPLGMLNGMAEPDSVYGLVQLRTWRAKIGGSSAVDLSGVFHSTSINANKGASHFICAGDSLQANSYIAPQSTYSSYCRNETYYNQYNGLFKTNVTFSLPPSSNFYPFVSDLYVPDTIQFEYSGITSKSTGFDLTWNADSSNQNPVVIWIYSEFTPKLLFSKKVPDTGQLHISSQDLQEFVVGKQYRIYMSRGNGKYHEVFQDKYIAIIAYSQCIDIFDLKN